MKVNITETVLRDGNQSLIATRLPLSDFEPILTDMDNAGYHSIECWGGATFDTCLRFLNEDPWERLRTMKSYFKKTKLQMLLRGQNLVGYKHYADDSVEKFAELAVKNGIDIVRIFDALNDYRNIETAVKAVIKAGGHAQGCIAYTISPIHNLENYVKLGQDLVQMGVHSICIKDMAGIMGPQEAYDLISALKKNISLPIILHTHSTTGLGPMTYLKAVEAGCDGIDTAIAAFSGGTSQPATESMVYALKQMGHETTVDIDKLKKINDFFKPVRDRFIKAGVLEPVVLTTDTDALVYQVPGGMLSNLVSQLKMQNALDKLDAVLAETPKVREELGWPPLVTPMSQMVGVQAAMNVLMGERYKNVSKEIKAYVRGEYGKAPGVVSAEIQKKVLGDELPVEGRFADSLAPEFAAAKAALGELAKSDEDVLSYILFPQQAESFLRDREERRANTVTYTITRVKE